ncbi:MAG: histidine kinase [Bacteroidota bacterium]|nr:histidine kinase [Bacteroidota bacterium]
MSAQTSLVAQDIDNLNIEKVQADGLTNNRITCISQDNNGFLWFGTAEGLFKYDGYNFKAFKNFISDSRSAGSNNIRCLYPEKNNLWVGSLGGLSCIDIDLQKIKNFPSDEFVQVVTIVPKNDSVFWIGASTGLFQFNKKNAKWKRICIIGKNNYVNSIIDDKKNHLYVFTQNGFYFYTPSTGACKLYEPELPSYYPGGKKFPLNFSQSLLDCDGNIWISTWGHGIARFNPLNKKITSWCRPNDDVDTLPFRIAFDMLQDDNRNIWIANLAGGLTIFNPAKNKFINYPIDYKSENKLSGEPVSLFRDRSGIFWIGTNQGIFKNDPHSIHLAIKNVSLERESGSLPSHERLSSMCRDQNGIWWIGTYTGLYIFDEKKGILQNYNKVFGFPTISPVFNIIQDSNGAIWLNAKNMLVKVSEKAGTKNISFKAEIFKSQDIQSNIYSLYIDDEKRIWIGTHSDGIFRFDQASKKFISYDYKVIGIKNNIKEIRTFCEMSKDSLLIGGEHTGLLLLHTNTGRIENIPWDTAGLAIERSINVMNKTGKDIWIGTEYNGLWKLSSQFKKLLVEPVNDGMPSMNIVSIKADKENNLWILTIAGVVKFQIADKRITLFDDKYGIKNGWELSSIIIDNKSNIVIGATGCIYSFNPADNFKNSTLPAVYITGVKVFDKEYNIKEGEPVELNYNQNYLSFDFVALNYTRPYLNKYAYKMDGLDKKWNDAGSRRYVSYANLNEGTYTFEVKACNNEGVWNNVPAKLIIIINPPFWHRWWFYLLCAFLIVSAVYAFYRYNINQLRMRMHLRDNIARDLHDDISSTLSSISYNSEVVKMQLKEDDASLKVVLDKIGISARNVISGMNDIVWIINPQNDTASYLINRMKRFAAEILDERNIQYKFNFDEDEKLKLNMQERRNIYLIYKEAIHNAVKYSQCSNIEIDFNSINHIVSLNIKDDGRGFDTEHADSGNGLANMKSRAKEIKAKISINSKKGEGTWINLNCKIT